MPSHAHSARRATTVVVGAGQAGLALSRHLTDAGHDHVVLERGQVGERWRSERWPSLHLQTPSWLNRLPGAAAPADPHAFQRIDGFVADLEAYAGSFAAPIHEHAPVRVVTRAPDGFRVVSRRGTWHARHLVVATGDCDRPRIPALAAGVPAGIRSLHGAAYTTPDALPPGPVLVVGSGPTGQQLGQELNRAGRRVVIAVGRHARMLRRYRGRDAFEWLHALGALDDRIEDQPDPRRARRAPSFVLSGAAGGRQLDLAVLRAEGVELAGHLIGFDGPRARFAPDLQDTTAAADARLRRLLDRIDAHVAASDAPAPPPSRPAPVDAGPAPAELELRGFGAVLWATGYRRAHPGCASACSTARARSSTTAARPPSPACTCSACASSAAAARTSSAGSPATRPSWPPR